MKRTSPLDMISYSKCSLKITIKFSSNSIIWGCESPVDVSLKGWGPYTGSSPALYYMKESKLKWLKNPKFNSISISICFSAHNTVMIPRSTHNKVKRTSPLYMISYSKCSLKITIKFSSISIICFSAHNTVMIPRSTHNKVKRTSPLYMISYSKCSLKITIKFSSISIICFSAHNTVMISRSLITKWKGLHH